MMNNVSDQKSILTRLKAETRENHVRIEKVNCMKRLFSPDYSLEEYRALLVKMYGFYAVIEPVISGFLENDLLPEFQFRIKTGLLIEDLIDRGLTAREIEAIRRWPYQPFVNSQLDSLGVWYVLEGSTLGGQMISTHLAKHFGEKSPAHRFHDCYGENTRAYWLRFGEVLKARVDPEDESQCRQVVHAAKSAFDHLNDWMEFNQTATQAAYEKLKLSA